MIAFDLETSGELPEYALQPWRVKQHKAWITSFVWGSPETGLRGALHPTHAQLKEFLDYAIENKCTVAGWNVAFDIAWLMAYGFEKECMQIDWLDGKLLWRHWFIEPEYDITKDKRNSYGLKKCVAELLPQYAGYEADVDFHTTDRAELEKLHYYNKQDVKFTYILTKHWYSRLQEEPQRLQAALIEAKSLPLVARANVNGMVIDTLATKDLGGRLDTVAANMLNKLSSYGVTEEVVRSPKQLAHVLFDVWQLSCLKKTVGQKTGVVNRSTDKEVLHELSLKDSRAAELRLYREALNNKTKFVDSILESVNYNNDGHVYPQATIFGTYTSRMTYSSTQGKNKDKRQIGFALHQMKRSPDFRRVVVPPPGYTLVEFDAASQEFRWMAIASNDETMLQLCLPGEDAHSFMGAKIAQTDYKELMARVHAGDKDAKESRQLGKVANLSLQYRTSAKKLMSVARVQYNILMELGQAQHIHATYQRTYPGVPRYWDKQIALTKRLGYVETFAGRRVQVRGNWSGSNAWAMGSTAINYRVQGTGGDQKYLALATLRPYLTKIGGYLAWEMHDGIYLYIPNNKVQQAVIEIKQLLDNLPYKQAWGFVPPIPLPWDCKIGFNWGDMKELTNG